MFIKNEFVINGDSVVIFYYKFVVIYLWTKKHLKFSGVSHHAVDFKPV